MRSSHDLDSNRRNRNLFITGMSMLLFIFQSSGAVMNETYFITVMRNGSGNFREWYVSEVTNKNSFFTVYKKLGMLHESLDQATQIIEKKIKIEGGYLITEQKAQGVKRGIKRGPYKNTNRRYL